MRDQGGDGFTRCGGVPVRDTETIFGSAGTDSITGLKELHDHPGVRQGVRWARPEGDRRGRQGDRRHGEIQHGRELPGQRLQGRGGQDICIR